LPELLRISGSTNFIKKIIIIILFYFNISRPCSKYHHLFPINDAFLALHPSDFTILIKRAADAFSFHLTLYLSDTWLFFSMLFTCNRPAFCSFSTFKRKKKGNLLCRDGTRGEASTGSAPVKYLKFYYYLVFKYEIV
jgi:hypothetical protein